MTSSSAPARTSSKELLNAGKGAGIAKRFLIVMPPGRDGGSRTDSALKTERVTASPLLGRIKDFLPQMKAANHDLESRMRAEPAANFDIEAVPDDSDRHIEMNLALGVLDVRPIEKEKEVRVRMPGDEEEKEKEVEGRGHADEDADGSAGEDEDKKAPKNPTATTTQSERKKRKQQKTKKPRIEVLKSKPE